MDEKEQDHVAAFDMLFTTNQLQLMKVLLPCLSPSMQKYFAIYIKYQELQYTISYFKGHPYPVCGADSEKSTDLHVLLPALLPYCNDSQKKMLRQLEQTISSFKTYQEMMEMMEMLKDLSPPTTTEGSSSPEDNSTPQMPDMDVLLSLLAPEQQGILEYLKGGTSHEGTGMDE